MAFGLPCEAEVSLSTWQGRLKTAASPREISFLATYSIVRSGLADRRGTYVYLSEGSLRPGRCTSD